MPNTNSSQSPLRALTGPLGIAFAVFVIDIITKTYFESTYNLGESRPVTSFFNLVLAHNYGAAFSFLADSSGWQRYFFAAIAVVAVVVCLKLMISHTREKLFCLALALILGGAIGNLFDRIIYGYVIDFLDFYYGYWHWPAFNIADSAIVLGAGLLIVDSFLRPHCD
ncbi:MAG: signal peptidase II [Candidatus Aphodousia sp.]|nr:signal peptidase II [Sutterella sp.]MDY2899448.1 signal peptidase II [Candidatus Aphodousia sp.]